MHLTEGQYIADTVALTITENRVVGLIRLVVANGGMAGTLYRTTLNASTRTGKVEIVGQEDADDETPE